MNSYYDKLKMCQTKEELYKLKVNEIININEKYEERLNEIEENMQ